MITDKKRIFITGATGFVGAHLAKRLTDNGHDIHLLIRKDSDLWRIRDLTKNTHLYQGDLADRDSIRSIIGEVKPEGIFHLGASTIMSGVSAPAQEMIRANLSGTVNLIEALSDIDYHFLVNTGTFIEYRGENRPVNESDLCEPKEIYSITKLGSTLYARAIGQTKNKPIVTLRLFTPYGPLIQKGKLIEQIIIKALEEKKINLTKPTIARDFIFIDDLVDLFIEAAGNADKFKGEIFNAGSGLKTTIKELADYVLEKTGSVSKIVWNENAAVSYDLDSWQADMSKTLSSFSWRPKHSFHQGIDKTIEFYRNKNKIT